jgi:hypothetical protein
VGLNISLPHEQYPNPYLTPSLCFQFRYFAIRKLHFLLRARALVVFPGGFGTMDELFETLTLIQTRKVKPVPVILVGKDYWRRAFDPDFLVEEGVIDPEDRDLFWYAETAQEIWDDIVRWYERSGTRLIGLSAEGERHEDYLSRSCRGRYRLLSPRHLRGAAHPGRLRHVPGRRELHEENASDFGFDPADIDVLLLTHAHLDHCGRIPLLVKRGFRGEIICTSATRDLTRLVLLDSAHLHEEEAKRRRRHRHGGEEKEPLYDTVDALDSLDRFGRAADYGRPVTLWDGAHGHVPRRGPYPGFGQHPAGTGRERASQAHPLLGRYRPGEPAASERPRATLAGRRRGDGDDLWRPRPPPARRLGGRVPRRGARRS